ncbi:MAG TPA: hypothetical protein VIC85_20165 [Ktedonobacterales bacterium]|jgi:hypothetical protein
MQQDRLGGGAVMEWLERHEQRLRALEAENRELRRQLDELRWNAERAAGAALTTNAQARRASAPYPAVPHPATPYPNTPYAAQSAMPGFGSGSVPAIPAAGPLGHGLNGYPAPSGGTPLWSSASAPIPVVPAGGLSGASGFFAALSGSQPVPAVTPYGTDPSQGRMPSQAGMPRPNPYATTQPGGYGSGYAPESPEHVRALAESQSQQHPALGSRGARPDRSWDSSGQSPARRRPSYPPPPVGEPERRAPTSPPREQRNAQGEERNPYTDSFLL